MGIKSHMRAPVKRDNEYLTEKLYREERNYRLDRLVEKWSKVPEIGKGITNMPASTARNLAVLLENQTRVMSKMTEAQLSQNFFGYTPENMLRLVRLSYPNSIRGMLFTEFAMESAHDSIKYIMPVYTNAQRNDFDWDLQDDNPHPWDMNNRFDDVAHNHDVMYESSESRYATELINGSDENIDAETGMATGELAVKFIGGAFGEQGENYINGFGALYVVLNGKRTALAMQDEAGAWFGGKDVAVFTDAESGDVVYLKIGGEVDGEEKIIEQTFVPGEGTTVKFPLFGKKGIEGDYAQISAEASGDGFVVKAGDVELFTLKRDGSKPVYFINDSKSTINFAVVGRYDSEKDLTGKYLGEVELQMRDYHFRPRPITLGVTWTQLTELVLDTSFGVSAEEMLMDSAAQEIKKTLDFQAVKYANDVQKTYASDIFVRFDAEAGANIDDSYYHTAQLVGQAVDRIGDLMLNKINRGGVTAIVGGPGAITYLKLNKAWSDKGAQPKIGGHKVGELGDIPVFKVPAGVVADNQLITTWKNPAAESDVSIAIGTLMPFYSTGALQRKNLYKEAAVARFEDMQALQPGYLGRIQIDNIRCVR
jgi:hypothetical protein